MAEISNDSAWTCQRKKSAVTTARLQSYATQSLSELADKLVKCSREEKGPTLSSRTRDIVYVLKTHKLRHSSNAHSFDGRRGVEGLLALFSLCAEQEGRDRGLLVATLANLCALDRGCRAKVSRAVRKGEWLIEWLYAVSLSLSLSAGDEPWSEWSW